MLDSFHGTGPTSAEALRARAWLAESQAIEPLGSVSA